MKTMISRMLRVCFGSLVGRSLIIFLPLVLLLGGVLVVFYHQEVSNVRSTFAVEEFHHVEEQTNGISGIFKSVVSDLMFLAKENALQRMLDSNETGWREALADEYLAFAATKRLYDQIRFLDEAGMEVVRVNFKDGTASVEPGDLLQSKASRYYFADAMALGQGEVYVSPFDLNVEHGEIEQPLKPMIRFGTPVFDRLGRKRGAVILNYLGKDLLDSFETVSVSQGQFMLLNSDGFWLLGPKPEDAWGFMLEERNDRTFGGDFPEPWQKISAAESGQFSSAGGMFTFATVYPLAEGQKSSTGSSETRAPSAEQIEAGEYHWKVVSWIPPEVLNVATGGIAVRILQIYAGSIVALGAGSYFLASQSLRRKRTEEALRRSEENLRNYLENAPDGVFIYDLNGVFIYGNKEAERITGYSREELIGKNFFGLPLLPEEYLDKAGNLLALSAGGKPTGPDKFELVRKDGARIAVEISTVPVDQQSERVVIGFARDTTERRRIEQQLQDSQLLASLGEMTAGIAHEVSNPLSAILLYSELIDRAGLPTAARKDIRVIRSEARRAANIMKDLLTYSRKQAPITRRQDVHKTLRKVLQMRRYQERVRNIDVTTNLVSGPLRVAGNAAQLTQLFMNLIMNAEAAVENSDDKRIVVTTEVDNRWASISIADSGTGIPEEHLVLVFVPFFSTKPTGQGTGLGLSICHGIVTAHGGLIRAENNTMGGCTFTIELPLAEARK